LLFDIYGRFQIEIERDGDAWVAYRQGSGVRRKDPDVVIPSELTEADLPSYLDDLFHEYASHGAAIRKVRA